MSRQEGDTGSVSSEYLTVPELAKVVRRNRKTVYGWIATGEIGEADGLFVVQGRFSDPLADVPCETVQASRKTSRPGSRLPGGT
jgi:hypothetical protein